MRAGGRPGRPAGLDHPDPGRELDERAPVVRDHDLGFGDFGIVIVAIQIAR